MLFNGYLHSRSGAIQRLKHTSGFTIVELTIVIIVIGILAAITVVSYNAITQQSRTQALGSDLQSTAAQLKKYKADQGSFPASLSSVTSANSTTKTVYTYYYRANSDSYCLEATAYNTTMRLINTKDTAETGSCNLTAATTTNLVKDPSLTAVPTGLTATGVSANRSIVSGSTPQSGSTFFRFDITGNGPATMSYALNTTSLSSAPQPNTSYTTSLSIRPSKAMLFNARYSWTDSSNNTRYSDATAVSAPANVWTRFAVTAQFFSTSNLALTIATNAGSTWSSGDDLDVDSLMVTQGTANYDYADGTSSGWSWAGTANNSASTGPARISGQPVYQ